MSGGGGASSTSGAADNLNPVDSDLAQAELLTQVQQFCLDLMRPSIAKVNTMASVFDNVQSRTAKLEEGFAELSGLGGKVDR